MSGEEEEREDGERGRKGYKTDGGGGEAACLG